jgi:tetratricopeptide (TPR) repeat protein
LIYFELFKKLDTRLYRTAKAMESSLNPCTRYLLDGDYLIILGTNVSVRWNLVNKEISDDNPFKHFDLEDETLYWFSHESAEGQIVRMASNAFRQWYGIDPFESFAKFEQSEADINRVLGSYGLRIMWDMDKMAVLRNDDVITFETAVAQIMEDDALRAAGMSIDEWLYDARYFRQTDQLERAIEQYERVIRYSNYNMRDYTESAFCLGESYYFLGDYERAVSMYYHCNLDFIEDENDFYIHIGHALLDARMKHYEKELRTYYRGCLDQSFAMNHMREIERAAAEVAGEFDAYEETCLIIGHKKFSEHLMALPMKSEELDEILVEEADKQTEIKPAKNRYHDIRLIKPMFLKDTDTISLNESMSIALEKFMSGEYQNAYELYYKLADLLDPESDYATWVNFQLGKLYLICNDPKSSYETLKKCRPGKFGVVYRQTDFFILYTHVKILCDDFESDERFRKLIRGKYDNYYARYDQEYVKLRKNVKIMNTFRRYERECLSAARTEFVEYVQPEKVSRSRSRQENGLIAGISKYFNE